MKLLYTASFSLTYFITSPQTAMGSTIMELIRLENAFVHHSEISKTDETATVTSLSLGIFNCLFPCCFFMADNDDSDCSSVGYMGSDEASCGSFCDTDEELLLYGESVRLEPNDTEVLLKCNTPANSPEQLEDGLDCRQVLDSRLLTPRVSNTESRPVMIDNNDVANLTRDKSTSPSLVRLTRINTFSKVVKASVSKTVSSEVVSPHPFGAATALGVKNPSLQVDKRDDEDTLMNYGIDDNDDVLSEKLTANRQQIGTRPRTHSDRSLTTTLGPFPSLSFSSDDDDDPLSNSTTRPSSQEEKATTRKRTGHNRRVPPDWTSPNACFYNQGNATAPVSRPTDSSHRRRRRRRKRAPSLTSPNVCFYNCQSQEIPVKVRRGGGTDALCRALDG